MGNLLTYLLTLSSSRFGRQAPKGNGQTLSRQTSPTSTQNPTLPNLDVTSSIPPNLASPINESPAHSENNGSSTLSSAAMAGPGRRTPFFFREENAGLIVKGNFMTLAARPEYVDMGEWIAHQVVEQYRLLEGLIKIIQEVDQNTGVAICNTVSCPTMSAGSYIYTWLDKSKNAVKIPACQYISLVQQWTLGKINDTRLFPIDTSGLNPAVYPSGGQQTNTPGANAPIPAGPTNLNVSLVTLSGHDWLGKSSGFPENFKNDIRSLYRQMFRCYAHMYWYHWLEPFYHLSASKELNTCFIHFVNVGKLFDLLDDKDLVPMQPLVDIWVAKGLLPAFTKQSADGASSGPT